MAWEASAAAGVEAHAGRSLETVIVEPLAETAALLVLLDKMAALLTPTRLFKGLLEEVEEVTVHQVAEVLVQTVMVGSMG
jgi:hypothetical protein